VHMTQPMLRNHERSTPGSSWYCHLYRLGVFQSQGAEYVTSGKEDTVRKFLQTDPKVRRQHDAGISKRF
jgi:hypothetical protein